MADHSPEDNLRILSASSRWERYRLAEKTLRFHVYRWMETYVIVSFVASLALPWLGDGLLRTLIVANIWGVAAVGVAHHAKLVAEKPWLLAAAAFEAAVLWVLYWLLLSRVVELPYFGAFCVFIFVLRYWMRGEREVNARALANQGSGSL